MASPSRVLDDLNDAQRDAVLTTDGPLLVIAGAGSGKTRVITRRIARLIEVGVPEETILAVTFTNKAAREMRERVQHLVGTCRSTVSTFHSFGTRFLRVEGRHLGRSSQFTLLDRADSKAAAKVVAERLRLDASTYKPQQLLDRIGTWKSRLLNPTAAMEAAISHRDECEADAYAAYEELLAEMDAFDFDDLIEKPVRLIESDTELTDALAQCFGYVLVDEYQDVNLAQYRLTRALGDRHANICVTGDPDQCIYSWRGADIGYILGFAEDYPAARVVRLEQNYRSRNTILEAASAVIRFNERHGDKHLRSDRGVGSPIDLRRYPDEVDEARGVVDRVNELIAAGVQREAIAIFYRLNSLSAPIERALIGARLPYRVWRGLEFFKRKEVKDAMAWLRALANPADRISLLRVINLPARGIGDKTIASLETIARARGLSLGHGLLDKACRDAVNSSRARSALHGFADLYLRFRELLAVQPIHQLLPCVLEESGYLKHLEGEARHEGMDPLGNIAQLLGFAREFGAPGLQGVVAFLEEVALLTDQDAQTGDDGDRLALMTVHTAKGLEFDHVLVVGLDDGVFPHRRPEAPADLEEERRLFYVALTRARETVDLFTVAQRTRLGRTAPCMPSVFLTEIPESLTREHDHVGAIHAFSSTRSVNYEPELDPGTQLLRRGSRVRHAHFGHGTVRRVVGRGQAARVEVDFDESGRRLLMLGYAALESIDDHY